MVLTKELKTQLVEKFGKNIADTGSVASQVAIMTKRIEQISAHLAAHPKDHSSRRGLLKIVGKRKRLLDYLRRKDFEAYKALLEQLEIRK